jgi:shikimate kinase
MLIFLLGMPASGKSTLGKMLSKQWGWEFIDLDQLIEKAQQKSIPDIFSEKGEDYFRKIEKQVLQETMFQDNTIIATGGGTPCFGNNMEIIQQKGFSVFIDTPLSTITDRIWSSPFERPLFSATDKETLLDQVDALYQKRLPFYAQADCRVQSERFFKFWKL